MAVGPNRAHISGRRWKNAKSFLSTATCVVSRETKSNRRFRRKSWNKLCARVRRHIIGRCSNESKYRYKKKQTVKYVALCRPLAAMQIRRFSSTTKRTRFTRIRLFDRALIRTEIVFFFNSVSVVFNKIYDLEGGGFYRVLRFLLFLNVRK